ncbi:MAG: hypothetical protein JWL63_3563 [Rhodocyclales bacterium]|nr:hypothetical protein [Rhodocyclales bacterium]
MKRFILAAAAIIISGQAFGATVNIFGRVDIGGLPQPPVLILPSPVIVQRGPTVVEREPVYLHVPPGHRKQWSKHCGQYNACGERVYFVQDDWYQRVYVPEHERRGREHSGRDRDHDRHDDHRGGDHDNGRHRGH